MKKQHQYDKNDHLMSDDQPEDPRNVTWESIAISVILFSMACYVITKYFPVV